MSATIVSLASYRQPPAALRASDGAVSPFKDFDEVCAYELPVPIWVNDDLSECAYTARDTRMFQAFFAWFGVDADLSKDPEGHSEVWAFLLGELGSAAGWRVEYPNTFRSLCGDWSQAQLDYLSAVTAGDQTKARLLLGQTPLALSVRQKMRTRRGPH